MKITKHTKLGFYEGEEDLIIHKNPMQKKKLLFSFFMIPISLISLFFFSVDISMAIFFAMVITSLAYSSYLRNYMITPCCKTRSPRITLEQPNSAALYECRNCGELWSGFVVNDDTAAS